MRTWSSKRSEVARMRGAFAPGTRSSNPNGDPGWFRTTDGPFAGPSEWDAETRPSAVRRESGASAKPSRKTSESGLNLVASPSSRCFPPSFSMTLTRKIPPSNAFTSTESSFLGFLGASGAGGRTGSTAMVPRAVADDCLWTGLMISFAGDFARSLFLLQNPLSLHVLNLLLSTAPTSSATAKSASKSAMVFFRFTHILISASLT